MKTYNNVVVVYMWIHDINERYQQCKQRAYLVGAKFQHQTNVNICWASLDDIVLYTRVIIWLGIRGTQVKSSIQDIVDEVAPIKKAPLWS